MAASAETSAPKRRARSIARLRQILDESLACFAEQGFTGATYDDLIRRSNVSRGSFYWYFPSKEALYDAVLDDCVDGYVGRLEAQFAKTSPGDHVVKRLLEASFADFAANRARYALLMRPPPSAAALAKLARWNDETLAFMRAKLDPLVAAGRLDTAEAAILPPVLSAFIDGVCLRALLDIDGAIPELSGQIADLLCRIIPGG